MFVDQAKILVKGGRGGNGCSSLYSDMYVPQGVPDGGDGGIGADIVIIADRNLRTLLDFKYNTYFAGHHGGHGSGKQKKGKNAAPVVIRVPVGTEVMDALNGCVLFTLSADGQSHIVARGGKGGRGNRKNRLVTQGQPGEERVLKLDLKLLADAGVVGFPNAGKSTLISAVTNAHPDIAAYPFTTKSPVLGMVGRDEDAFVIADIPGLIEGSSQGKGLGDRFLRHVERTKILVHMVDMSGMEGRDPLEDYRVINRELKGYSLALSKKPQVIAANKMDLPESAANLKRFKRSVRKPIFPVSAKEHTGLDKLMEAVRACLKSKK